MIRIRSWGPLYNNYSIGNFGAPLVENHGVCGQQFRFGAGSGLQLYRSRVSGFQG